MTSSAALSDRHPCEPDTDPRWLVAGGFLDALTRRDFDAMAGYLDDEVRFRAVLPPAQLDIDGPEETIAKFRQWLGDATEYAVQDAEIGQVGSRLSMRWRLWLRRDGVAYVIEQHVFVTVGDRIVILDLLCSGFHREDGVVACSVTPPAGS